MVFSDNAKSYGMLQPCLKSMPSHTILAINFNPTSPCATGLCSRDNILSPFLFCIFLVLVIVIGQKYVTLILLLYTESVSVLLIYCWFEWQYPIKAEFYLVKFSFLCHFACSPCMVRSMEMVYLLLYENEAFFFAPS